MSDPFDRPRITINWARVRPVGWRAWAAAVAVVAVTFAALALVAIIASTLFVVALFAAVFAAIALFVGSLFRGRNRDVGPYRGNYDA